MVRGKCYKCKVTAGPLQMQGCWAQCVFHEEDSEESARLRDFQPLKSDGVDYTGTNHLRGKRTVEDWAPMPGWANIVSGKCNCLDCKYTRLKHNIKQMVIKEKQRLGNS